MRCIRSRVAVVTLFHFYYFCFMKCDIPVIVFILTLWGLPLNAQKFNGGMLAGVSTSQVSGDTWQGFDKAGVIVGGYTKWDQSEKSAIQVEMEFIQKGSRKNADPAKGDFRNYLLRLDYVDMYFLYKYTFKKFIFEAGPSVGILVRQKEEGMNSSGVGISQPLPFNAQDICLSGGMGYRINKKLVFNARYTQTFFLTPIRQRDPPVHFFFIRGQYNTVLAFSLQYQFGKHE